MHVRYIAWTRCRAQQVHQVRHSQLHARPLGDSSRRRTSVLLRRWSRAGALLGRWKGDVGSVFEGREGKWKGGGGCTALYYTAQHCMCRGVQQCLTFRIRDMGWMCISIFADLGDRRCAAPHIFLSYRSSEENDGVVDEGFDAFEPSSNASSQKAGWAGSQERNRHV